MSENKFQYLYDYDGELPKSMIVFYSDMSGYKVFHEIRTGVYLDHECEGKRGIDELDMQDMGLLFFVPLPDDVHEGWEYWRNNV